MKYECTYSLCDLDFETSYEQVPMCCPFCGNNELVLVKES